MAVLLTAMACFLGGFLAGWVVTSSHATWTMSRLVDRKQREIRVLEDEVVLLKSALRSSNAKRKVEWGQAS